MTLRLATSLTLLAIHAMLMSQTARAQYAGSSLAANYYSETGGSDSQGRINTGPMTLSLGGGGASASAGFTISSSSGVTSVSVTGSATASAASYAHSGCEAKIFFNLAGMGSVFTGSAFASGTGTGGLGCVGCNSFNENITAVFHETPSSNLLNNNGQIELRLGAHGRFQPWPPPVQYQGQAFIVGFFHEPSQPGDPDPPLPGSDPENAGEMFADTTDLEDLRSPGGDNCPECSNISLPMPIAGNALTPVVDSLGRTSPLYLRPPNSGAGLSVQSIISVTAYRYKVSDNLITHFTLPTALPGGDGDLQIEVGGNVAPYTPGALFDLTQYVPGGVSEFFLSGIDPEERLVLPPVSGLRFASNGIADIRIAPADISVFADYNSDGIADAADYVISRKQGGSEDYYNAWRHDFGTTLGGGGTDAFSGAIPEPSTFLLAAIGGCLGVICRRHRRAAGSLSFHPGRLCLRLFTPLTSNPRLETSHTMHRSLPLICILLFTSSASAINITMNFNSGASASPSYDSNHAGVISLFNYAAAYYEDVFQDAHDITINYWYENLSGAAAGSHGLDSQSGSPNRETVGHVRIDTNPTNGWYIDATPGSNSEFTMQQTLWRDISSTNRSDFYNFGADIPETFEVDFHGFAYSGPAAGPVDMLSVILHEVGHALGMQSNNNSTVSQTSDNDYDFNPAFVFGKTLAAEVADGPNIAHLDNTWALMNPGGQAILVGSGPRTLPSHTDLFSMASGHQYTNLDVPRREFYGGPSWNTNANWSGNAVPGTTDDAYVRIGGNHLITFAANTSLGNLHVEYGEHRFSMGTRTLTVNSETYVDKGGTMSILSGTLVATNRLRVGESSDPDITTDGTFEMSTGSRVVVSDDTTTSLLIGQSGWAVLNQSGGTLEVSTRSYFGNLSGSRGTYNFSGGDATFSDHVYVGNLGRGVVIHSGSANAVVEGDLILGNGVNSDGGYELNGGDLQVSENLRIGYAGTGEFIQNGGEVDAAAISIGELEGGVGHYELNDGIIDTHTLEVGKAGTGYFTQYDGDLYVSQSHIVLGHNATGDGAYQLDGGQLSSAAGLSIYVGFDGAGTLCQSGGDIIGGGSLQLAVQANSEGHYVATGGIATYAGAILVGRAGDGYMEVTSDALVSSGDALVVARDTGSFGEIIQNGGRVDIATNAFLAFSADTDGDYYLNGGELHVGNDLEVGYFDDGLFRQTGGSAEISGDLMIGRGAGANGRYELQGGTLDVSNGAISFGSVDDVFQFTGGTLHVGTYNGNLNNQGGILAPGDSANSTQINGTYSQSSAGTLAIDIFDTVYVTGEANLGGNLYVSLLGGYFPAANELFTVFNAASIVGQFENAAPGAIMNTVDGLGSFRVHDGAGSLFDPTQIVLSGFAPLLLAGDYNNDNIVDAADYVVWRKSVSTNALLANDAVGGQIGAAHYNQWKSSFGTVRTMGGGPDVWSAVPEPSGLLLAVLGGLAVCASGRRRHVNDA